MLSFLAPDPICTIGAVAIDLDHHSLFVLREAYTQIDGGKDAGIYIYSIGGLKEKKHLAVPSPDGRVEKRFARYSGWFDTSTGSLLIGSWAGLHTETGELTAIRSLPSEDCERSANPIADDEYLVYRHKKTGWRDIGVFVVSRKTLRVERQLSLPPGNRDVVIEGAIGDLILARAEAGRDSHQLIVFEADGSGLLKEKSVLDLADYRAGTTAVDHTGRRWAVSETAWRPKNADKRRLRVYEVPSLRVLHELPEEYFSDWSQGMVFVPSSPILLVKPKMKEKELRVLDTNSGKLLKVLPADSESRPFSDDRGRLIGSYGCTEIRLFRVGPE